ncbi:hypothetical protein EWB00_000899 [Schistosoma japonicum]|uniref:Uncharacterized protein n=1 Tax=Schistosoma japonicum TaxID=6182 RepID=A0A4Z2CK08_SCHJA|nr:hypothetical protein EWB00_000899 [Schistosoma japonicum]
MSTAYIPPPSLTLHSPPSTGGSLPIPTSQPDVGLVLAVDLRGSNEDVKMETCGPTMTLERKIINPL